MKKEGIISLIIYLLILGIAVVYGLTVLQTHFQYSAMTEVWQYAIYIIGTVLVGVIISAILAEFGHLIGAHVGGYKIITFNILYFAITKEDGKTKFKFKNFDGLTGETVIVPNYDKKAEPNPIPYLLYGPLFNLAWFAGCLVLFFIYNKGSRLDSDIAYGFLTAGIIAMVLFTYNMIPTKLDTTTDGYRLSLLAKSKSKRAFNDLLLVQYNSAHGNTEAAKEVAIEENTKFTAESYLAKVMPLLFEKKFDEAKETLNKVFEEQDTLSKKGLLEAQEYRIYINIMTMEEQELLKYYDEDVPLSLKREISSDFTMNGIRTYILMAGLLDKARSECLISLSKLTKAYKNTPRNRQHSELVLFNEALEKVCNAHPKWELEVYKLYE